MRAPSDLGPAGRSLLKAVAAHCKAENLELDEHEEIVLLGAARDLDAAEACRAGRANLDPADAAFTRLVNTERAARSAARVAMVTLCLPFGPQDDAGKVITVASRRAQKAGRQQWLNRAQREAEARRSAG